MKKTRLLRILWWIFFRKCKPLCSDKFDKNGDGNIDLEECAELLGEKADQFGLSKKDIHKQIQHFFNLMDVDMNQQINLLEFFIELPKVEAFLSEKKLGK